jgi:hypothetical protein
MEMFDKAFKNYQQHICFQSNGITIAEEYFFQIAIVIPGHFNIFHNFGNLPHPVLFVFIHAAESALIMGTAYSALKQVAVGFTKWPEYVAFVSQFFAPFTTPILNQSAIFVGFIVSFLNV